MSNTLSIAAQLLKLGVIAQACLPLRSTLFIKLPRAWPPGFFLDSPGGLILLSLGQERTRWTGETQASGSHCFWSHQGQRKSGRHCLASAQPWAANGSQGLLRRGHDQVTLLPLDLKGVVETGPELETEVLRQECGQPCSLPLRAPPRSFFALL